MLSTPRIEELASVIAASLFTYMVENRTRTDLLRNTATLLVDLREQFTTEDGNVDWAGRSADYRATIADIYTAARIAPKDRDTVQSALRYHVGNALRRRLDSDTLSDVGMQAASPKQRRDEARRAAQQLLQVVPAINSEDVGQRLAMAEVLLGLVDPADLIHAAPATRHAAGEALLSIGAQVSELLRHA